MLLPPALNEIDELPVCFVKLGLHGEPRMGNPEPDGEPSDGEPRDSLRVSSFPETTQPIGPLF
jgi:hypothetical protein